MKKQTFIKFFARSLTLSLLLSCPLNVYASEVATQAKIAQVEKDIGQEINRHDMKVENNVNSLITNSERSLMPDKIAQLFDEKGRSCDVPMYSINEEQIYSQGDLRVLANTYAYDLPGEQDIKSSLAKASTGSGSQYLSRTDNTVSVRGYCTIYYTIYYKAPNERKLTSVSGGYTVIDKAVSVTKQNVQYGQIGIGTGGSINEKGEKNPTGKTFSYQTGFKKTLAVGYTYSLFGMNYRITMKRTSSSWTLLVQNMA